MKTAIEQFKKTINALEYVRCQFPKDSSQLGLPVYCSDDGTNLQNRTFNSSNDTRSLLEHIVSIISQEKCHWDLTCDSMNNNSKIKTFIDFGPGGFRGIGSLTLANARFNTANPDFIVCVAMSENRHRQLSAERGNVIFGKHALWSSTK